MSNVELMTSYLSFLRPRPDYRVDEARKFQRGYIINGTKLAPKASVCSYLDDCVYVEETTYPKAIRYVMRMGSTVTEPIFIARIEFEGKFLGNNKKRVYVTVYMGLYTKTIELSLDDDPNLVIRKFFAEEISNRPNYLTEELSVPYKRMLDFLEPRLKKSMIWLNSKEADLEELSKKR